MAGNARHASRKDFNSSLNRATTHADIGMGCGGFRNRGELLFDPHAWSGENGDEQRSSRDLQPARVLPLISPTRIDELLYFESSPLPPGEGSGPVSVPLASGRDDCRGAGECRVG